MKTHVPARHHTMERATRGRLRTGWPSSGEIKLACVRISEGISRSKIAFLPLPPPPPHHRHQRPFADLSAKLGDSESPNTAVQDLKLSTVHSRQKDRSSLIGCLLVDIINNDSTSVILAWILAIKVSSSLTR